MGKRSVRNTTKKNIIEDKAEKGGSSSQRTATSTKKGKAQPSKAMATLEEISTATHDGTYDTLSLNSLPSKTSKRL